MEIKHLGPITNATLEFSDGMIFIGPNNSGKTYLTYTLYLILTLINDVECEFVTNEEVRELLDKGRLALKILDLKDKLSKSIAEKIQLLNVKYLPEFFNISKTNFKESSLEISNKELLGIIDYLYIKNCDKSNNAPILLNNRLHWASSVISDDGLSVEIKINIFENDILDNIVDVEELKNALNSFTIRRLLFKINNILYIPAERNGLNVFRKELLANRSSMFDNIASAKKVITKYPKPISDYLNFLNLIDMHSFFESSDIDLYNILSEKVIKGKFEKENDDILFRQFFRKDKRGLKYRKKTIPFHVASSSAKSLYGLDIYFEHLVSRGDILFIDEPEMNLDPISQANMAEFLCKCIEYGVKVVISTHSYNLVRSFINMTLKNRGNNISIYQFNDETGIFDSSNNLQNLKSLSIFEKADTELIDNYYEIIDEISDEKYE